MGFVKTEQKGHVAILTIDRPEALNALTADVLRDLGEAMDAVEANDEAYVVILTGAGRSFVAGADIGEMKPLTAVEGKAWGNAGNDVFLKVENCTKPVIAAINGFALGGGCELAMACDIRLASEKAKFGQPEVGLGITPGFSGTQRLPRRVGTAKAKELIFSGRMVKADEAERMGLVNAICAPEELMDKAMEMAQSFARNAPIAVKYAKACIDRGMQMDIDDGIALENELFAMCFATADQKEGMLAFLEKRDVAFENK